MRANNSGEWNTGPEARKRKAHVSRIVRAYDSAIVKLYCQLRFVIIRQHFLDSVGQYLPEQGRILDVGCGFGLFSLYFAGLHPHRSLHGYDLNASRIETARRVAANLGIENTSFELGAAGALSLSESFQAAYALDIVHHLPETKVRGFLEQIHAALEPGGYFLIKDVDYDPAYKRWFTLFLDRAMVGLRKEITYWPRERLQALLREIGFQVYVHELRDFLPYPHILYVCQKH